MQESMGQGLVVVDDVEVRRRQQILKREQEAEEQRRTEVSRLQPFATEGTNG